jgi:hypothetical protein
MRILSWDLETSNLKADYGIILCCGFKEVGTGKPEVISLRDFPLFKKDPTNDRELCKAISARLLDTDCWLTWYGRGFDVKFLNTRLLFHGLPPVPPGFPHIDGWLTSYKKLLLRNNRLRTVQEFLGLEEEKDAVKGPIWIKALSGDLKSFRYIINHCRKDVLVLEQAYEKLRPLLHEHPRKGLVNEKTMECPVCEEKKLQKRGMHVAASRKYQRYSCTECGTWSRSPKPQPLA